MTARKGTTPRVTSYTRAPKRGTPAYDLWLMQRRATFDSLRAEFLLWCRGMVSAHLLADMPRNEFRIGPGGKPYDHAFVRQNLLIELDGISWNKDEPGGHLTASGYERDRRKDGEAIAQGWRVLRLTGSMLADGTGYAILEQALWIPRKAA